MIAEKVIVDTGPLVALLVPEDFNHQKCADCVREIHCPMLTSWAVLTEAAWLLRSKDDGLRALLRLLIGGTVVCGKLDDDAASWIAGVAAKYADLSPQLADLTLLYLAEREQTRSILTLDRRDFTVFRSTDGQPFHLLPDAQ